MTTPPFDPKYTVYKTVGGSSRIGQNNQTRSCRLFRITLYCTVYSCTESSQRAFAMRHCDQFKNQQTSVKQPCVYTVLYKQILADKSLVNIIKNFRKFVLSMAADLTALSALDKEGAGHVHAAIVEVQTR